MDAADLLARLPEPTRARLAALPELAARFDELIGAARSRWPAIVVDEDLLLAELAERIDPAPRSRSGRARTASVRGQVPRSGGGAQIDDDREPIGLPAAEVVAELYLAAACAGGATAAIEAFDTAYLRQLAAVLSRFRPSVEQLDEIAERLREQLLVGGRDAPPLVVRYAGRGGLHRLITVAAIRLAIDLRRGDRSAELGLEAVGAAGDDPDLGTAYAGATRAAFERAIGELSPRDRTLLHLHVVDRLTVDDIATIYRLHRASAARRVETAREAVARGVRRHLRGAGVDRDQLEELFAMIHRELDLSITRVLRAVG